MTNQHPKYWVFFKLQNSFKFVFKFLFLKKENYVEAIQTLINGLKESKDEAKPSETSIPNPVIPSTIPKDPAQQENKTADIAQVSYKL